MKMLYYVIFIIGLSVPTYNFSLGIVDAARDIASDTVHTAGDIAYDTVRNPGEIVPDTAEYTGRVVKRTAEGVTHPLEPREEEFVGEEEPVKRVTVTKTVEYED